MKKIATAGYSAFMYLFLYLPLIILIVYSVNNSQFSLMWRGFTLNWYQQLLTDHSLQIVALHSLIIAVLSATIACLLGMLAATCLHHYRFFTKTLLRSLIYVLIILPDIVMAISLLLLFAAVKIPLGFWSLLLAHITFCLPFVTVIILGRMGGLNKNIFEAAKDLGASDITIFTKIIIPMMLPAVLAGWLISFTLSIDDVVISYFVSGPTFEILPLRIYSMVRLGIKPEINALCSVMIMATLLIIIPAQIILRKKQ